jgi:hypothetical protein
MTNKVLVIRAMKQCSSKPVLECTPYLPVCTRKVALELLGHCIVKRRQIQKSSPKLFGVALERCTGE